MDFYHLGRLKLGDFGTADFHVSALVAIVIFIFSWPPIIFVESSKLKVITFLRVLTGFITPIPFTNQRAAQRETWASVCPLSSPWAGLWQYNQSSDIICQEKKCIHAGCSTESSWALARKSYLLGADEPRQVKWTASMKSMPRCWSTYHIPNH